MPDLQSLRSKIADKIEQFFDNELPISSLRTWAADIETEIEEGEHSSETGAWSRSIDYWIVEDALWTILLMDPLEPEDYRATKADLERSLAYLRGTVRFPAESIPREHLSQLRAEAATAIESYLAGSIGGDELVSWANSRREALERSGLPQTAELEILVDGLQAAQEAVRSQESVDPSTSRKRLLRTVRYLTGAIRPPGIHRQVR